jgi:hypothetical protein
MAIYKRLNGGDEMMNPEEMEVPIKSEAGYSDQKGIVHGHPDFKVDNFEVTKKT